MPASNVETTPWPPSRSRGSRSPTPRSGTTTRSCTPCTRPGVKASEAGLGGHHRNYVDGRWVDGRAGTFEVRSPIDSNILLGTFAKGDAQDVRDAIAAARRAQPAWRHTPWQERLTILRRAAELISERQMKYGADMAYEVGKTRLEAMAEVEESADLLRYYAERWPRIAGTGVPWRACRPDVRPESVLLPYGVWAVVAPFNFPSALAAGMIGGASGHRQHGGLQAGAGGADIGRAARARPLGGWRAAGDALQLVHGPGAEVG